ncbi:pentatricopeptide repeat-containing protein-like, chloroplastic/mitochondrial [Iris pallida]|uniref:Pentatricopeptide repeat-containing protein-like, chloroplastic/mitochondrial n=1 Tax=Iris pallida TaxID=29817 RepID=A0AAX6EHC9_IRIPA|nr:pentatricopeptide repeat-containing protein-like, chloroplastic/mitochondrial [Iris pallida]
MMSISPPTIVPPAPPPPPSPSSLLPLLEQFNSLPHVRQIHARALKSLPTTTTTTTTHQQHQLLLLYSRLIHHSSLSSPAYASLLLLHPLHPSLPPNSFCFNTLIRAAAASRDCALSLSLYLRMLLSRVPPDSHTFPFLLKSCSHAFALPEGTQLHAHVLKLGLSSDPYVSNSLIHLYSSCALLAPARHIFLRMPRRTPVSWNVIVDAHCVNGHYEAALRLFRDMMADSCRPDAYSLQSLLCACAGLGSLSLGAWAHAYMLRRCGPDVVEDVLVSNSLVDLYSKCGALPMARQVFLRMPARDVASYNAMLLGCSMNGRADEALDVFARMRSERRLEPDSITFVGVLSACKHGGLVDDGRRYFRAMADDFGIEPRLEHYGCMVDLLARAGRIDEALDLVNGMRCKPDAVIWRSILDACCKCDAGVRFGESLAKLALASEEVATSGAYVLLSKIYASANRWNDVGLIRGLMSDNGVRKEPGCSSIEIDGIVHEFVAGDTTHPRSTEIYEKLNEIERRLALVGYKPDPLQAHLVAELEGAKSDSLRLHSERLAIALGLLSATKGTPLRILKNLRVCRDCHTMTKLISSVYRVEIIVRDRTRFHHFRDGSCSCSDYW